jgi:hypothetical protein
MPHCFLAGMVSFCAAVTISSQVFGGCRPAAANIALL